MKTCFISDTHTYHEALHIPECDVLVHCGDSTFNGEIYEMNNFLGWFGNQKAPHKIFINGNHEVQVWKRNLTKILVKNHNNHYFTNINYLEEEGIEIEGVKFWGSPYTPQFFDWAYMYPEHKAMERWLKIPSDVDILLTHGPPYGILDGVTPIKEYPKLKAGCKALLYQVEKIQPKIHAFGHIHEHYGTQKINNTLFVNAASCNEQYIPVNAPIVIDYEKSSL